MSARPTFPPRGTRRTALAASLAAAGVLAACSPLALLDRTVPGDTHVFKGDIAYGADARQKLDVFRPLPDRLPAFGARPLVVFFYGGTWSAGDRADFRFVAEALASAGAVVVLPDYRLSPRVVYPAFVRDSALAVKWAIDHAVELGADPAQIYVMGHSSGAYNAAMVALDARWLGELGASPAQLAGWIGMAGPYDFLPIENPRAQVAFDWPRTPASSQPMNHVSPRSPRALLLAATKDDIVDPVRNTRRMAEHLASAGVPVETRYFDDLGHLTLIGAVARSLRWIGGPVLPPILEFLRLPPTPRPGTPR
ncbi:MAG: alpha/beta hydrolase [Comamonadaceae bacterium]|nr:MAG: alpha/beta hydrolase [Comamonadaceae bacterium]